MFQIYDKPLHRNSMIMFRMRPRTDMNEALVCPKVYSVDLVYQIWTRNLQLGPKTDQSSVMPLIQFGARNFKPG